MEFLPNTFSVFVILRENQPNAEAWVPAISALSGALIGGISTSLVCFYTIKKEREKEILLHKITLLDKVSKKFLIPLLDYRYELTLTNNSDKINDLLIYLRSNRNKFLYCPVSIKKKLDNLYMKIEKKDAKLNSEEITKVIDDIIEIENEFYDSFIEMKL